jgi:predicted phage-related endonuclease
MTVFNTRGLEVNSPQWLRERIGHLTASNMWKAMDFRKDGKPGADRIKYLMEIVAERSQDAAVDHFVTPAMQHGLDYEDEAKALYVELGGGPLVRAEFIKHPEIEYCGATPDALVGDDGLLEVKCPTTTKFIAWKLSGIFPAEHVPQCLLQLACTRRRWVDLMAYDPRIKKGSKYFIRRLEPTAAQIEDVENVARQFLAEADRMFYAFVEQAA